MANLPTVAPLGVTDVDASTLAATKYNLATNTPTWFTVGDTTPTGNSGIHLHKHTGSGFGHQLFRPQPGIGTDKMLACTDVIYQFMNPFDGPTSSSCTIQCTVNPTVSGDTIRLGPTAYTYTFVTALTGAYDVLIGGNAADTMRNLVRCITNQAGGSGSDYHAATPVHPTVTAISWATNDVPPFTHIDTATITARAVGNAGNSVQVVVGTAGDGTFVIGGGAPTLTGGGGQMLTRGSSYYLPGGWQGVSGRGYRDSAHAMRLVGWSYAAPAIPTVQDGGGGTANAQLELVYGAGTTLFTLTASGAFDALGKIQYSTDGGTNEVPAGEYVWARVPSAAGGSWQVPPGAVWSLHMAMVI